MHTVLFHQKYHRKCTIVYSFTKYITIINVYFRHRFGLAIHLIHIKIKNLWDVGEGGFLALKCTYVNLPNHIWIWICNFNCILDILNANISNNQFSIKNNQLNIKFKAVNLFEKCFQMLIFLISDIKKLFLTLSFIKKSILYPLKSSSLSFKR